MYTFTVKVFLQTPLTHTTCTDKKRNKNQKKSLKQQQTNRMFVFIIGVVKVMPEGITAEYAKRTKKQKKTPREALLTRRTNF